LFSCTLYLVAAMVQYFSSQGCCVGAGPAAISSNLNLFPPTPAPTLEVQPVVAATLQVTGVEENALVADKAMQVKMVAGFTDAVGVASSSCRITKIGSTTISSTSRPRRLANTGTVAIEFEIRTNSAALAVAVKMKVSNTNVAAINAGMQAAGVTGVTAAAAPSAISTTTTRVPTSAPTLFIDHPDAQMISSASMGDEQKASEGMIPMPVMIVCALLVPLLFFACLCACRKSGILDMSDEEGNAKGSGSTVVPVASPVLSQADVANVAVAVAVAPVIVAGAVTGTTVSGGATSAPVTGVVTVTVTVTGAAVTGAVIGTLVPAGGQVALLD
jgi:hypothetical protein